ncbi:DMT family transporter [Pararhodobacter sp.]|uniref:DMT family transporter n=1 Tax=Pararhodobacter sp. TaxID=2127056 RepID=UPI002AFE08FE|nr:DMT family transporter [Pararhodobacter sp.]
MSGGDWLRLIVLSVLWGGSFFFVSVAVPVLPPFTIVLARVGLGAMVLALMLLALRIPFPKGREVWIALAVMGLLNNVVPFTLFALAQGQISSGLASILNATTPLWSVVVAHLATRDERMTPAKALGVMIGFGGVAVMMGAGLGDGTVWAQMACVAAAISYALSSVWARRFRMMGLRPLSTALGQVTMSSAMLLPLVIFIDQPWTLPMPSATVLGALVGLAVLSTALAYGLYFGLLSSAGAVNASLVTFLIPVSAIALGVLVLGEVLLPRHIAGMVLIAVGLAVLDGRLWRKMRAARSGVDV